jgi:hypothetical protein
MFLRLAPRAAIQAPEVDELVGLAGYLPLAISLLARVYAKHPTWTLAHLAAETKASLFTLAAEKDNVAAAFDVSYRYLSPDRQRFFRYLGLPPGTVIDAYAAAVLAGVDLQQAVGHLDGLHGEGLLAEVGYRRYGMHDLLRHYAHDLAVRLGDDSQSALERLLDFYQHKAASADSRAHSQMWPRRTPVASPPTAVPGLTTIARVTQWLRAERVNLLACLDHVGESGRSARVAAFTAMLTTLPRQEGLTIARPRHNGRGVKSMSTRLACRNAPEGRADWLTSAFASAANASGWSRPRRFRKPTTTSCPCLAAAPKSPARAWAFARALRAVSESG